MIKALVIAALLAAPATAEKTNSEGFTLSVRGEGLQVDSISVGFTGARDRPAWCGTVGYLVNEKLGDSARVCGTRDQPRMAAFPVSRYYSKGTQICLVVIGTDPGYFLPHNSTPCVTIY